MLYRWRIKRCFLVPPVIPIVTAPQTTCFSKEWCRTVAYWIFPAGPSFLQLLHHHKATQKPCRAIVHVHPHAKYCTVLSQPAQDELSIVPVALGKLCLQGLGMKTLCSTSVYFWNDICLFGALGTCNSRRRNNKVDLKLVQYTHPETKVARTWCIIFSYHRLCCCGKCSNEEKSWLMS